MESFGEIEIRVSGKSGNFDLSPENYDIKYIINLLQNVEDILFPANKKERPIISYSIENGSVRHIFKTTTQTVIGFSAILAQIILQQSIDFLQIKTARAIESLQDTAKYKNYEFHITTSMDKKLDLIISPNTKYYRTENSWIDAEFYFYGTLKDAGGKNKANIHLDTIDFGYLTIETGQKFLKERKENLLYKQFGVRVRGKQNIKNGEFDTKSLKLIELIDYEPRFDKNYISGLITKAKKTWKDVDTDEWLEKLRGDYEL